MLDIHTLVGDDVDPAARSSRPRHSWQWRRPVRQEGPSAVAADGAQQKRIYAGLSQSFFAQWDADGMPTHDVDGIDTSPTGCKGCNVKLGSSNAALVIVNSYWIS